MESGHAATAISERPRQQLSRCPGRTRQDADLQGREARPGSSRVPSPAGLRIHNRVTMIDVNSMRISSRQSDNDQDGAEDGELESLWLPTHPASDRRPHPGGFILRAEGTRIERVRDSRPGLRFPAGHLASRSTFLAANLPSAEGGLLESHASQRASASNGARHACPVHPPWCRPRDSDPEPLRSERSASANWARAAWSG